MKTINVNLYQYNELSDKAKEKARNWWLNGFNFAFEWDCLKDDAKTIGIELSEWEYNRILKAKLIESPKRVIALIKENHGKHCDTYKTAVQYEKEFKKANDDDALESITADFLHALEEDYRVMADQQFEYCQSDEAIAEVMESNKYMFLEDGTRF